MIITDLTPQQLRRAADIQEKIAELQQQLNQVLGVAGQSEAERGLQPAKRRKLSPQGIANIRAGARRRWAAQRRGNHTEKGTAKPKRRMSAAAKAAIAAAARARWARWRAERNM